MIEKIKTEKFKVRKLKEIRLKDEFYEQKKELIEYWKKNSINKKVIDAFLDVPRENFVSKNDFQKSYNDAPLDIGYGQTISQPTTIILMLNWLDIEKDDKILEIGTGSGYNSALLSKLCKEIVSTERIKELVDLAKSNLKKNDIKNVEIKYTPKELGYMQKGPYDKIIVTCGADAIPEELLEQLKDQGVMLIPIGEYGNQMMIKIRKKGEELEQEVLGWFSFVPLIKST